MRTWNDCSPGTATSILQRNFTVDTPCIRSYSRVMEPASHRSAAAAWAAFACTWLAVSGCTMFEMEQPRLVIDSGLDASSAADAAIAVSPDARECPPAPAGCTAFRCAATASCYYACSGPASWSAAQ